MQFNAKSSCQTGQQQQRQPIGTDQSRDGLTARLFWRRMERRVFALPPIGHLTDSLLLPGQTKLAGCIVRLTLVWPTRDNLQVFAFLPELSPRRFPELRNEHQPIFFLMQTTTTATALPSFAGSQSERINLGMD